MTKLDLAWCTRRMGKDAVNQMETRVEIERFKAECGIQGAVGYAYRI